ncbi:glycosyltransferase family 4 protein [Reinekea sp. G2M2-21]|uniref:glycosyltransferase family 4 protein n=1 Tax=Reinekea sp. G2M2-21 TaxID=2788942 RepID=UPI0018A9BC11|nr:glycosyltransferase family 4 protein [Reinekea sp. G2M2-21]
MKAIIFTHEYPPFLGGAGSVARNIFGQRCCLNKSGIDLFVFHAKYSEEVIQEGEAIYARSFLGDLYSVVKFIFCLFRYDIIIANDKRYHKLGAFLNLFGMSNKVIYFMHGQELESIKSSLFRVVYKRALRSAKNVVFVSEFLRRKIGDELGRDYRSSVLRNTSKFESFVTTPLSSPIRSKSLLTVSRLVPQKGLLRMVDLYIELVKFYPELEWHIVGDGPLFSQIKDATAGLNVTMHGALHGESLAALYQHCSVNWLLSEYEESFGLTFLESASFGVPSIAYSGDGAEEVLRRCRGLVLDSNSPNKHIVNSIAFFLENMPVPALVVEGASFYSSAAMVSEFVKAVGDE